MSKSYLMAASTRAADADAAGGHSAPAAVRFEGDADGALARAYECDGQSKAMEMKYPMHCMKMSDFLQLTMLEAHNGLVERGLVVPLNFDGKHAGVEIQFVSHQWLGYTVADPNGDHLTTMQAAFRIAIDEGKGLFKSHEDWKAYAEGMTTTNATSTSLVQTRRVRLSALAPRPVRREPVQRWTWRGALPSDTRPSKPT